MPSQDPYIAQELLSHQTFLRRLATDLVGRDADDLVQDVWQRALERPPHHGLQLRSWLARVARNLAADRWRGEARRTELKERGARERSAGEELEARFELRKELVGALDTLSPSCRETILLRYFEGLAPRDIARRQGAPVATVKARLRRGLGQLREALDRRHGGDRATWMSGVAALAAPVGSGAGTGTLVIGGIAMGTMMKVSAAVVVVAVGVYFVTRTPPAEIPPMAAVEPPAPDGELVDAAVAPAADPAAEAVRQIVVAEEPPGRESAVPGTNVLRVVLEGITEEDARMATVTLMGVDEQGEWPLENRDSWLCQGLTSAFDLDPFLANVERHENLSVLELEVEVDHPHHLSETTRVALSHGVGLTTGQTVHEVRVPLVRPVFWPEITLTVRDAHTRAHLQDVEIRCAHSGLMGLWRRPGNKKHYVPIGEGLRSPIALMGGREPDEAEVRIAGLALLPAAGESPRLVELASGKGVIVYARAPGYAWDRISVDLSSGDEYELLLGREATLSVRLTNVQLERYAAIEVKAKICVYRLYPNGNVGHVWFQDIDETLVAEGLRLVGLKPGDYSISVKFGELWPRSKQPVLAREEVSLAIGERRELVLHLADPPEHKRQRATLAGVVSFPAFGGGHDSFPPFGGGYEWVRLDLFEVKNSPVSMLGLTDMERTDATPHTWSFRVEDLPEGRYQFLLRPFMVSWMVELPPGGREDLELVIWEFAEVLVETVDARTGERVPLDSITFGLRDLHPDQIQTYQQTGVSFEGEPGRFRFGTTPGAAFIQTHEMPSGHDYGWRRMDLELVPGPQSVRLELRPRYAIRFEFRENGEAPPPEEDIYWGSIPSVRAVEHGGHVTHKGFTGDRIMEVSAPGVYEVSFEGVTAHLYQSIPPRRVDVRAGETTEVIVELHRQ